MDGDRWPTVAGFLGAIAVLAALVWLVGIGDIVGALAEIRPAYVAVLLGVVVCWLFAWGLALRTVLGALDAPISVPMAGLVFAGAVFSNNVTPFGQAGGEPVSAYLIARATDREYETGLAAIASVDALHFVPSLAFAASGLTFILAGAVQLGRNLAFAATAIAVLAVGLPAAAYVGWHNRYELEAYVVRVGTPVVQGIGRLVPRRSAPGAAAIERRIEAFFRAIERVATDRRTLVTALGFSAIGWLAKCLALWVALLALGYTVPISVALFVVPMGAVAGMTPLPGGLGGVDFVVGALLLSTTGLPQAVVGAAVLVDRGATYVFPTVVGGGVAFALGADRAV